MAAGICDLLINQGETFSRLIRITNSVNQPINLTGYTAKSSIKASAYQAELIVDFTITFTNRANGELTISLTDTQTSAIPTKGKNWQEVTKYIYDMELTSGTGVVKRILQGTVSVSPEVSL